MAPSVSVSVNEHADVSVLVPMMVSLQRLRPRAAVTLATLCFFCSVLKSLGSLSMAAKYSVSHTVNDSYSRSSCSGVTSIGTCVSTAQWMTLQQAPPEVATLEQLSGFCSCVLTGSTCVPCCLCCKHADYNVDTPQACMCICTAIMCKKFMSHSATDQASKQSEFRQFV